MFDFIEHIQRNVATQTQILRDEKLLKILVEIGNKAVLAYKNGHKILIAGNGGSAADAQHFAAELVARFQINRAGLSALALSTDTSILTAIGNDFGFDEIFARQIEAHAERGDLFFAISTSGNSRNLVKALPVARERGCICVGLTGSKECQMDSLCDYLLKIPAEITATIQEAHIMLEHILCGIIEQELFGKK